jgi:glycosyltransferase involved in cell wall biosynthesis
MPTKPDIQLLSAIVPVGGRHGDARKLYAEYKAGLAALPMPSELLFVLDGPRPKFSSQLDELHAAGEQFIVITLTRSFGDAAALMAGVERAAGDAIVTLPAHQQIEAADIRKLVATLETVDVAVAMRSPRAAGLIDRVRRATFHRLVRSLTGLQFNDLGCGARAVRRRVFDELDLYGEQHRFLPVIADRLGFRVAEVAVRQSEHDRFQRVYRPREYARYAIDLFSIFFLVRFTKRPLRFFGMLGATTFSVGAAIIAYLCFERLMFNEELADRPALLLGALLVVLGMQIFALGLLGELIIFTHARDLKDYRVEEVIQYEDAGLPVPEAVPLPDIGSAPQQPDVTGSAKSPVLSASPHAMA